MMSTLENLIALLAHERQDLERQKLLRSKGYFDPTSDDFCLNQWTRLLASRKFDPNNGNQEFPSLEPDQLVSIIAIPHNWVEQHVETNSPALHDWLVSNRWTYCPALSSPFEHARVQACSEGVILPRWISSETSRLLERFLLIRRDGVVEFGLGRETYSLHEKEVVFQLLQVVGRLWQFLGCLNDLVRDFFSNKPENILCFFNMRGTRNALLGDLAEGWKEPHVNRYDSYRPRCPENHLQVHRTIQYDGMEDEINALVRWFATRIDNAWGQFEPRCYVPANVEESQPFAHRNFKR
jgi:hypothetical protein